MFNSKYNKMKTKKETLENEYKNLRNEFENLHFQLLEKKEFILASKLSEIYHETSLNQYKQGVEFMKNLYKL
jgi:GTPase involved in cell partitioning and DNA repair